MTRAECSVVRPSAWRLRRARRPQEPRASLGAGPVPLAKQSFEEPGAPEAERLSKAETRSERGTQSERNAFAYTMSIMHSHTIRQGKAGLGGSAVPCSQMKPVPYALCEPCCKFGCFHAWQLPTRFAWAIQRLEDPVEEIRHFLPLAPLGGPELSRLRRAANESQVGPRSFEFASGHNTPRQFGSKLGWHAATSSAAKRYRTWGCISAINFEARRPVHPF